MAKKYVNQKKLIINIDEAVHRDIKLRSILKNWTMTKWVLVAIANKIKDEDKYMDL